MAHPSQFTSSTSFPGSQLADMISEMRISEPNASNSSVGTTDSRTSPATGAVDPSSRSLKRQQPSGFRPLSFTKIKARAAASAGVRFAAGICAVPIVGGVLGNVCESYKEYENMGSNRHELADLGQNLQGLSDMLNSERRLLNTDQGYATFARSVEGLHDRVRVEIQAGLMRRLETATRLDKFNKELQDLLADAINAGHIVQKRNDFNNAIPSLKLVDESNGLVFGDLLSAERLDKAVFEIGPGIRVATHQAMYNDVPVEIKDYYDTRGNDYIIETLTGIVDDYHQRGVGRLLPKLHGGFVHEDDTGCLHVCLVLSPDEGTPWVQLVKAKQSIELLCQVAEKTAVAIGELKQKKQIINFEEVRVRQDGTLLLVPHIEGELPLIDEEVFNLPNITKCEESELDWPFKDLCLLLHESSKQGLVRPAVEALREHIGPWDQIAVWRVADGIKLRPPPKSKIFGGYPPRHWTINPGWIVSSVRQDNPEFVECVARLPESVMDEYERKYLTSFMITDATAFQGKEGINYFKQGTGGNWFLPAQHEDWECFPLEPWQGVNYIQLWYESVRLEMVGWHEWRDELQHTAQGKSRRANDLGVVSRTDVLIKINNIDIPELGTRPIYFYRRKPTADLELGADTSPQQYWGFFSFNQDPLGPTGLTIRRSGPHQWERIVSESLPPDPPEYQHSHKEIEIEIEYVRMCDDWSFKANRMRYERTYNRNSTEGLRGRVRS